MASSILLGSIQSDGIHKNDIDMSLGFQSINDKDLGILVQQPINEKDLEIPVQQTINNKDLGIPVQQPINDKNLEIPVQQPIDDKDLGIPVQQPINNKDLEIPVQQPINDKDLEIPVQQSINGKGSPTPVQQPERQDFEAQLRIYKTVSRFLPEGDEAHSFWWRVTGKHVARMMHEARYPEHRQVELLLFYRFCIVPRLGPRPTATVPRFWSRIAPGIGDGSPISYSWRWGTGPNSKPLIRHYIEPIGLLTGTPADPLNEIAAKEMLWELGKQFPATDLSLLWKFAAHIRPNLSDDLVRKVSGSSMLVGLEWPQDRDAVDVMAALMTRAPSQVNDFLKTVLPGAMCDAYGAEASMNCLNAVREFIETDPRGNYLTVLGTTALDCCEREVSRFKVYVTTHSLSFDHIACVMTLGGRKPATPRALAQLRELWYGLKGLPADFPTSAEPPPPISANGHPNGKRSGFVNANVSGVTFYFDIHPKYEVPHIKVQIDVSKHSASDAAAIEAVSGFLERRGQGQDAQAYKNVVLGMVSEDELRTRRGLQAFFALAIKNDEIDITSYFLPQVYRRLVQTEHELLPNGKRRSRFDSNFLS